MTAGNKGTGVLKMMGNEWNMGGSIGENGEKPISYRGNYEKQTKKPYFSSGGIASGNGKQMAQSNICSFLLFSIYQVLPS